MDLLLAHAFYLADDPHEREVMRPYPPLGLLYLSAYLKSRGFSVGVFDSTFSTVAAFGERLKRDQPRVVGIYGNLLTRRTVVEMTQMAGAAGARVVLGGPEPASYAEEYLEHGADVVVAGEGEQTLAELLPRLSGDGLSSLDGVRGIAYRDTTGAVVRTEPRPQLESLDTLPFPDREAIDIDAYVRVWRTHHGRGSVSLITARGCPYTLHVVQPRGLRAHPSAAVTGQCGRRAGADRRPLRARHGLVCGRRVHHQSPVARALRRRAGSSPTTGAVRNDYPRGPTQ